MDQLSRRHDGLGTPGYYLLRRWNPKEWFLTWTNRQCTSHQFLFGKKFKNHPINAEVVTLDV
jgi:hypothetical protein